MYYDDTREAWVAEAGDSDLLIGMSSADLSHAVRVRLTYEWIQATTGSHGEG